MLIDIARQKMVSAYVGAGAKRWATVARRDAAELFQLALEKDSPVQTSHGVAEDGLVFRDIAEAIGRRLKLPEILNKTESDKLQDCLNTNTSLGPRDEDNAGMLAHLGDQLCHTPEQRKSWSLNLGHSSVKVTWKHYGRVTDERKAAVFAEFTVIENWTGDEMRQMLDCHDHKLALGTPEFDHTQKLVEARRRGNEAT